ncbi:MAG: bifunctional FO biosynthesis protein CofGH [Actinomycetota bacterium]|nr:bifunctional FO biosynthesis protein CofGH [Actinomycetota bacterium]
MIGDANASTKSAVAGCARAEVAVRAVDLLGAELDELLGEARRLRAEGFGGLVTFSPKVFIPLTKLCRDVCHYCTFARPPRHGEASYLTPDEVLEIARAGAEAGCHEALFTLGDKPELRYRAAREELAALGYGSTIEYLAAMCRLVIEETGLLPHANPGVLDRSQLELLRGVTASQGIMLETISERLSARGMPHHGSPDKRPATRLETLELAGELQVPFTTGVLIGIGETRAERIDALLAIRDLHARHGHIQEVIVQNFRAKPDTKMAGAPEPSLEDLLWTAAVARIVLGPVLSIQVPPNLSAAGFPTLLDAGINDWGGVSPVTIDHVNPEAPWPELDRLRAATDARGYTLTARLPLYPEYVAELERWCEPAVARAVRARADASGLGREDRFIAGVSTEIPDTDGTLAAVTEARGPLHVHGEHGSTWPGGWAGAGSISESVAVALAKVDEGVSVDLEDVQALFEARGRDLGAVFRTADRLRREVCGDKVSYVVTRNINYTNVCYFKCGFCAFSKGKLAENLRGPAYVVPLQEIVRRCREAWERGAVEVCLQGGIHPGFDGDYYAEICAAIKAELPDLHLHAFSALEVWQGAATLEISLEDYLRRLHGLGLASLPGTAAEILDDEVRAELCPDKVNTRQWFDVHDTAHRVGLSSTTTIMFGHIEGTRNWAKHLLGLRDQQKKTGGFTEFVPLPFVHVEAPIFLKGRARKGPTLRESILMHAVPRLVLHPHITNIQASWPKLGVAGGQLALRAGANDFGGTLMNESISRAAGASHGQEMAPELMEAAITAIGRTPRQRTTLYRTADPERTAASYGAAALVDPVNPPVSTARLKRPLRLIRPGVAA